MNGNKYLSAGIMVLIFYMLTTLVRCSEEKKSEKDLQGNVYYSFNWSKALLGHSVPQRLRYCFYPTDGGSVIQMDDDADGLNYTLPPAQYRVLVFNCDAADISYRNMNKYETAEAFIPATKTHDGTQSVAIPLYGIASELTIKAGENNPVQFTPQLLVRSINIGIKVNGMENVTGCKGSISGMFTALNLSQQQVVPDVTATIDFTATPSAEGVNANILMLGKPKEEGEDQPAAPPHEVTLDFTLTDGSTASTSIDLGNSIEETDGSKVDVIIEATVNKSPVFTIKINRWEVATGDSLIIE